MTTPASDLREQIATDLETERARQAAEAESSTERAWVNAVFASAIRIAREGLRDPEPPVHTDSDPTPKSGRDLAYKD